MRILSFSKAGKLPSNGSVVTIGNFDGVHLGHQAILQKLKLEAQRLGCSTVVVLFEPQPLEYFKSAEAPPRLMNFRQKVETLKGLGVEYIVCLKFNQKLAGQPPETFVESILYHQLSAKYVLVGDDFRFGHQRQGNIETLKTLASRFKYQLETYNTVESNAEKISSSRVRALLSQSNFRLAQELLGRPFTLCGRVIHGAKQGRLIGVPTANIAIKNLPLILRGVFGVKVYIEAKANHITHAGVANIGFRPTVDGVKPLLEVHIFNFCDDLYGKKIKVAFEFKIRDEEKFDSFEALTAQIKQDIEVAKEQLLVNN